MSRGGLLTYVASDPMSLVVKASRMPAVTGKERAEASFRPASSNIESGALTAAWPSCVRGIGFGDYSTQAGPRL